MTPEEKFLHYLQIRRDVIKEAQSKGTQQDWQKAHDQTVLTYLDYIESDFHRAFGRESE